MRRVAFRAGDEAGFTLIEVLAAITIFAIITVGLIPLLASAMRNTMLTRSFAVEKQVVQSALENARGLPYFVTGTNRTDVLDLYFPNLVTGSTVTTPEAGSVTSGYSSTAKTFTTVCTPTTAAPSGSGPVACPHNLADGSSGLPAHTTLVFVAQFLNRSMAPVTPPSGYSYATATTSPSSLLKFTVTAYWSIGGRTRSFSNTTLIGSRKLNNEVVHADGELTYLVQVLTGYNDADGSQSTLSATLGSSDSAASIKAISSSDQDAVAGNATLNQGDYGTTQASTVGSIQGATAAVGAPPNLWPGSSASAPAATLGPQLPAGFFSSPLNIAGLGANQTSPAGVQVNNDLPQAQGGFSFNGTGNDSLWVTNQANDSSFLQLDPTVAMVRVDHSATPSSGSTSAVATAVTPSSSRHVEATVSADMGKVSILPTTFICTGASLDPTCTSGPTAGETSVVVITGFHLTLDCNSTVSSSASATGSWSATLWYWDGTAKKYVSRAIGGSSAGGTDGLQGLGNPLVFDSSDNSKDVYLFDTDGPDGPQKGYLSSLSDIANIPSSKDAGGISTNVTLDGAIKVVTTPTDPSLPGAANPTGINVTIGNASCLAEDKRG